VKVVEGRGEGLKEGRRDGVEEGRREEEAEAEEVAVWKLQRPKANCMPGLQAARVDV
jgi:hypothetical protein